MKVFMYMDYIRAYARYGHIEGEVNFSEEEEKDFRTLLRKERDWDEEELTIEEQERLDNYKEDIRENCKLVVDDWNLDDCGDYHWEELLED